MPGRVESQERAAKPYPEREIEGAEQILKAGWARIESNSGATVIQKVKKGSWTA